jgi:hypothetical protein
MRLTRWFPTLWLMLIGCATQTSPNPKSPGQDEGAIVRRVPVEILVHEDGSAALVTRPIAPAPLERVRDSLPDRIPVWSIDASGQRSPGVVFRNTSDTPDYNPFRRYPKFAVLMPDGSWTIDEVSWRIMDGWVRPRDVVPIRGSESARLMVAFADGSERLAPIHGVP